MRRIDDYFNEMDPLAISDSDLERMLRGRTPTGPGLTRLGSALDELRALGSAQLRPEVISRHVAMAAEVARASAPPRQPAVERPAPAVPRRRLIPRLGTSLAAFTLLLGMSSLALASDTSVPGDPLHGIDVFLENLGIGDGGLRERIEEARALTEKGQTAGALDHLNISLPDEDEAGAQEALNAAAERIGSEPSPEVESGVSEMLEWMATTEAEGKDFGQGVAELARSLGDEESEATESPAGNGNGKGNGASPKEEQPQPGKGQGGPPAGKGGK